MSQMGDVIRDVVGSVLPTLFGDTYTLTVDPHGTPKAYTIQGTPDEDIQKHRDNGLTIRDDDQVVILYQKTASPALAWADFQASDYLSGPSDAANRASQNLVITDVMRDPANATFILSVGT